MANELDTIDALLTRLSESLNVEVKTWLNPRVDAEAAKIIKAAFALRNRNGGHLFIGFNNATLKPDPNLLSEDVSELYHIDKIQGLISSHAHEVFEIDVQFRQIANEMHPILVIPSGVRTPVAVKKSLTGNGGKILLNQGDIYFRTLAANGTPSSAKLLNPDLSSLVEICFENREADIGRFLRRHLGGDGASLGQIGKQGTGLRDRAFTALETGKGDFWESIDLKKIPDDYRLVLANCLFMSVALALDPMKPGAVPTQEFMNRINSGNPNYTGWPVWLDTRFFNSPDDRAVVSNGKWRSLVNDLNGGWSQHLEYLSYDPRGEFFIQRLMQDDITDKVARLSKMDVVLMIYRVIEAIAAGISVARAVGWDDEDKAGFAFEWSGLSGRATSTWANPLRMIGLEGLTAVDDSAQAYVEVPLDTPHSALAPYVEQAILPLFATFNGYSPSQKLIESSVKTLVERKL